MSLIQGMNNENVVYLCYGGLLSRKKWQHKICRQIHGTKKNHTELSNPDSDKYGIHSLISGYYM